MANVWKHDGEKRNVKEAWNDFCNITKIASNKLRSLSDEVAAHVLPIVRGKMVVLTIRHLSMHGSCDARNFE